jgi:hypothetical protein
VPISAAYLTTPYEPFSAQRVRLQFAFGHVGQFRENDREIIDSLRHFKAPPASDQNPLNFKFPADDCFGIV